ARDWKGLNALLAASPELTPKEMSLTANAMWYQSRWEDSLEYMKRVGDAYPAEVLPYARLLSVLALERLERFKEAYGAALDLYKSNPPNLVRYYTVYALSRLTSNPAEEEKWLRRMAASSSSSAGELTALKALAAIDRLAAPDALKLLKLDPRNAAALKYAEKIPESPEKNYRLGYSAYVRGRYADAVKHLEKLKLNAAFGESGAYYLAMSLSRLKRPLEAMPLFSSLVFREKGSFVSRSLSRLSLMLGGAAEPQALDVLLRAARSKNTVQASSALYSLATSRWEKADWARSEYIRRFPSASRRGDMLWTAGWKAWLNNDAQSALELWTQAAGSSRGDRMARLLYWRAKALDSLGRTQEADGLREWLRREHSLSIYSFLTVPGGVLKVTSGPLPEELQNVEKTELEQWGFMTHARMELAGRKDAASRMNRASIALWLGQEAQAYADMRGVLGGLMTGDALPRGLLELAYPRPWRREVERAAKQFGVDPLLVWAIMRQESSFDPGATSPAGAAGLLQLMPATAAMEAKKVKLSRYSLYNISNNVTLGTSYISYLIESFKRLDWAVAAYNGGLGNVGKWNKTRGGLETDAWIESIPFAETNTYVKNVLSNYEVYKTLYAPSRQPEAYQNEDGKNGAE
ncbi:MAG: transglycosylase SLT domain-containing protein, partial [Pyramidobacter sp.]|nr:transglycosylase SLT domain-containing protein [Pyramidobacter sp.]